MLKKMKKTPFSITVTSLTLLSVLLCSLLAVSFSTIFYILIFGTLGLSIYAFKTVRKRGEGK
jgi:chromate transporter